MNDWRKLPVSPRELDISTVLRCGQSFRWKQHPSPDEWTCALGGRILTLKQDDTHLHYRSVYPAGREPAVEDTPELIDDYFQLSVDLETLYQRWGAADPNFKKRAPHFTGVRMLRQDPWENVVSFICSSNNNITRISQMVTNLCLTWGPKLGEIDGVPFHDFPPPEALASPETEAKLRSLGFGYRAKYIAKTAAIVAEKPKGWLDSLRKAPYAEAHEALLELPGVGPKVADCICLMSLDKAEAVPVDTHVWQIAQRDYGFGKGGKTKTLTKATYDAVGEHFRKVFGKEAGWAHSVLFAADLKVFEERTVVKKEKVIKEELDAEVEGEDGKKRRAKVEKVKKEVKVEKRTTTRIKREPVENGDEQLVDVKAEEVKVETDEGITSLAERVKRRRRNANNTGR